MGRIHQQASTGRPGRPFAQARAPSRGASATWQIAPYIGVYETVARAMTSA